ncbi:transposase [Streptomyces sp. NPDC001552]|uniref:transposase n=1 Tax=Streptomyces sp. NPDC001552 TaxID=3364587 RepID=UPI0036C08621
MPTWCGRRPAARSTRSCCWSSCVRSWPACQVVLSHRTGPSGPHPGPPCTVVLDNASAHVPRGTGRIGVGLFYLPPRSPELNDVEWVWRSAKYEDYPRASTPPPTRSAPQSTKP